MNTKAILSAILAVAFAPITPAAPAVTVKGIVTIDKGTDVTLDVVADLAPGLSLRSFGIKVNFDPQSLTLQSMGRYDTLWFLSTDGGATSAPYSDSEVIEPGCVRMIGGRFDATDTSAGVGGDRVLLGTLRFTGQDIEKPEFAFDLAHPLPFENFALADGTNVDVNVEGLEGNTSLTYIEPPADIDDDGLPDSYELKHFGDLTTSNGSGDTDGDGDSDCNEWVAGTDPLDPESSLELLFVRQPDGSKIHEWKGIPGRVYTLKKTTTLAGFAPLTGAISGIDGTHQIVEPDDDSPRAFYQLQAENPLPTP